MIEGATFHHKISGRCVVFDPTNRQIPKSHFEKDLALISLETITVIKDLRAPSYLYAIPIGDHIRQIDW